MCNNVSLLWLHRNCYSRVEQRICLKFHSFDDVWMTQISFVCFFSNMCLSFNFKSDVLFIPILFYTKAVPQKYKTGFIKISKFVILYHRHSLVNVTLYSLVNRHNFHVLFTFFHGWHMTGCLFCMTQIPNKNKKVLLLSKLYRTSTYVRFKI